MGFTQADRERIDQRFDQLEKQMVRMETTLQMFMESTNQRFEQVDQRFAEQREDINQRFEQVDKRFDRNDVVFADHYGDFHRDHGGSHRVCVLGSPHGPCQI